MFFNGVVPAILTRRTVEVTLDDGGVVNVQSLFSAGDWAQVGLQKRVILPAGKTRGSSNPASAVFQGLSGFGGSVRLSIFGSALGAGGVTTNGGDVIDASAQAGVIIDGNGNIKAGGGQGGVGGQGGQGVYYTGRTLSEGPVYDGSHFWAVQTYWDGTNSAPPNGPYWDPWDASYSYSQGTFQESRGYSSSGDNPHTYGSADFYTISRQKTVYDVPNYTSGGNGGAGGRGQGYDGAAGTGATGSNGGTNAGKGGTGGTGGAYGASGSTGSTGAAGNSAGGSAGGSGKLAGYAIKGIGNVTNNFTGTLLGRT